MQIVDTSRTTKETDISLRLNIDGTGKNNIETPVNFFSHMLREFSWHGKFDIDLSAKSLDLDSHHLVEDVAIVLGQAFREALGDKIGINRYGSMFIPMDDALCHCVLDISGRAYCVCSFNLKDERTSDFETVLLVHFFNTFAQNAGITLHIRQLEGFDTHHIIEAAFKAFARALKTACSINKAYQNELPSTKGAL
jgi:imidazoleglycerol-phosphate dehydratase